MNQAPSYTIEIEMGRLTRSSRKLSLRLGILTTRRQWMTRDLIGQSNVPFSFTYNSP